MGDTFREMLRGGFHPSETTVAELYNPLRAVSRMSRNNPLPNTLPLRGSCEKSEGTGS